MALEQLVELLIVLEDGREVSESLHNQELVVGRRPDSGLTLDDEYLSRKHCSFRHRKDRLSVKDLGSYNGTYVNGKKIHEECYLASGDVVKIGRSRVYITAPDLSTNSLRVYAPDLREQSPIEPIAKAKAPVLSKDYREQKDFKQLRNDPSQIGSEVRNQRQGKAGPPKALQETRAGKRKGVVNLSDSELDEQTHDASETLSASLSATAKYIPPMLSDEESETPTPIPDPDFTASAVMRTSKVTSVEEKDRQGLRIIAQLARVLHSVDDMGEFMDFALAQILEVVPAERGLLMRLDRKRKGLFVESAKSAVPTLDDRAARKLGISHTIAKKVIRDRVSMLVNDAKIDRRFQQASSIQDLQVRSILCTPVWYKDRVSGLIYLDSVMHAYAFTEADREFLVATANLIALGLSSRRRR